MGKHWAIAIGINQYQLFQPLQYGQQDAEALQRFLVEERSLPPDRALLLAETAPRLGDKSTFPHRETLMNWLQWVCNEQLQPQDVLWVFFSGHGVCQDGEDYLMPWEGDPRRSGETGIAVRSLLHILHGAATSSILLMLDMNRSQGVHAGSLPGRQTAELADQFGIATLLSAQADQFSHETTDLRQGLFTTALMEGLRIQHCETLGSLQDYLQARLGELCNHHWRPTQTLVTVGSRQFSLYPTADGRGSADGVAPLDLPGASLPLEAGPVALDPPPGPGGTGLVEKSTAIAGTAIAAGLGLMAKAKAKGIPISPALPSFAPPAAPSSPNPPLTQRRSPSLPQPPGVTPSTVILGGTGLGGYGATLPSPQPGFFRRPWGLPPWLWLILGAFLAPLGLQLLNPELFQRLTADIPFLSRPSDPETPDFPDPGASVYSQVLIQETGGQTPDPDGARAGELGQTDPSLQPMTTPGDGGDLETVDRDRLRIRNQKILQQARTLIQGNRASQFSDAIAAARQIQPGQPFYDEAQQDVDRWSQTIFDMAVGRAQRGDYRGAMAAVQLVPSDRALGTDAQKALDYWTVLDQQKETNILILEEAQLMIQFDSASSYNDAITLLRQIPEGQVYFFEAQRLMGDWSTAILDLAEERAAQGQYPQAIAAAALVPPETPNYAVAQAAIDRWSTP